MTRAIPTSFAIALAVAWSLLEVGLALTRLNLSVHPYANVASLAIYLVMAAMVLFPPGGQIPAAWSPFLIAGTGATVLLAVWGVHDALPGYAVWSQGALLTVMIALSIRRRERTALACCAINVLVIVGWCSVTGQGVFDALTLAAGPVALTLISVGFARFLALNDARAEIQLRHAFELLDQTVVADSKRAEALTWVQDVSASAGPSLRLAADPEVQLSEADRARMVQVEASLRDRLRGGSLATPAVLDVVAEARARGVVVSLLDDRDGPLREATVDAVSAALVSVGPRMAGGNLTVRARPESSGPPEVTIAYVPSGPSAESEYLAI